MSPMDVGAKNGIFFSTSVTDMFKGTRIICAERDARGLREAWKPILPPFGKKSSYTLREASRWPPNELETVNVYSSSSP